MKLKHIRSWVADYIHMLRGGTRMVIHRNPPDHYLGHVVTGKNPVILLPGVFSTWSFLKKISDPVSLMGHPTYVIPNLGYNLKSIPDSAHAVRRLIDEYDLRQAILLAHSKGGLIGRHLLSYHNKDGRVKKMIAVASPFGGSRIGRFLPGKALHELDPESQAIKEMHSESHANEKIVSIYGTFDNHVWPGESSILEGAKNIQVDVYGHHKILFDPKVKEIILSELS